MKKVLLVVALVVVAIATGALFVFGSPQGPTLEEVAHLRTPRLTALGPQQVLEVVATGEPKVTGKRAFALLMSTYFKLEGVPRGGPGFKAPRARWPVDASTPPSTWTGRYAMPVPDSVTALPAGAADKELEVRLARWDYGEVAEVLHVGSYASETPTVDGLKAFIAASGYEVAGDHEEEYLRGPGMLFPGDPATYLTVIRYPVRKASPSGGAGAAVAGAADAGAAAEGTGDAGAP